MNQIRLIDVVPRNLRIYVGGGGLAILVIAGLEALYVVMWKLVPQTTDGRVAAFDLDGEGSLAVWFSTVTLLSAAISSLLVYLVHADLPRGRRLWLWAAACWLTMSIDECASLHEGFKELMSHATGHRIIHDGTIWWVMAYFLVLSVIGLRLLWRMRDCHLTTMVWLSVPIFYGIAAMCELAWILPKDHRGVMLEEGCEMLGDVAILLTMLLYARHKIIASEEVLSRPSVSAPLDTVPCRARFEAGARTLAS